jgi:hypothetical protein
MMTPHGPLVPGWPSILHADVGKRTYWPRRRGSSTSSGFLGFTMNVFADQPLSDFSKVSGDCTTPFKKSRPENLVEKDAGLLR